MELDYVSGNEEFSVEDINQQTMQNELAISATYCHETNYDEKYEFISVMEDDEQDQADFHDYDNDNEAVQFPDNEAFEDIEDHEYFQDYDNEAFQDQEDFHDYDKEAVQVQDQDFHNNEAVQVQVQEKIHDNEAAIRTTREVLRSYFGDSSPEVFPRSCKGWMRRRSRSRSPLPATRKRRRGGQSARRRAKARDAWMGDTRNLIMVKVQELRYSQLSCKETFQCGRKISDLIEGLLHGKVSLRAPFLRLTAFEEPDPDDPKTKKPILKCIYRQ